MRGDEEDEMRKGLDDATIDIQRARAAAITAMGQRLAAAGPRTRKRASARAPAAVAQPVPELQQPRMPVLVAERSAAFVRDVKPILPPSRGRRVWTVVGRTAALVTMAMAGFALVLLAQSPRWRAVHHADDKAASVALAKTPAASAPLLAEAGEGSQEGIAPPALGSAPSEPTGSGAVAAPDPEPAPKPTIMPPKAVPPAAHIRPAPAAAPAPHALAVQVAAAPKVLRIAARHEAARVASVHYALPRWLTEARETPSRPLIMSPPPHDLDAPAPARLADSEEAARPRPVLPPLPRPRMVYASATMPPPVPYGGYYPP